MKPVEPTIVSRTALLLCIATMVMLGWGCSSETTGYSEPDAGDAQLDAGDGDDAGQEDAGDQQDADTGDPDADDPDADDADEPDDDVNCDDHPTLSDLEEWSPATDVIVGSDNPDPSVYTEVFPGDEFPGTSNNFPFYLEKGRYAAMEFTVPEDLVDRSGGWRVAPMLHSTVSAAGRMFATLTRCPGDFDVASFDDPRCGDVATTSEGWIRTRWTTDPDESDDRKCYIEPGETYYFNVLYTYPGADPKDFPPEQSDCGDLPNCGHHLQRGL